MMFLAVCVDIRYLRTIVLINTQIFILYCLLTIIRYAKENYRKRIKCTNSPESNTGRERTETRIESRRSKEYVESTRIGIRACKRNLFQSQRCKENTKEPRRVILPIPSFFSLFTNIKHKLTITILILDSIDDAPYMLKLLPYVWRSEVVT